MSSPDSPNKARIEKLTQRLSTLRSSGKTEKDLHFESFESRLSALDRTIADSVTERDKQLAALDTQIKELKQGIDNEKSALEALTESKQKDIQIVAQRLLVALEVEKDERKKGESAVFKALDEKVSDIASDLSSNIQERIASDKERQSMVDVDIPKLRERLTSEVNTREDQEGRIKQELTKKLEEVHLQIQEERRRREESEKRFVAMLEETSAKSIESLEKEKKERGAAEEDLMVLIEETVKTERTFFKGIFFDNHRSFWKAMAKLSALEKAKKQLTSSQFRQINEKLYTSSSSDAVKLIESDPLLFDVYHSGFREQVKKWPKNPVEIFISWINTPRLLHKKLGYTKTRATAFKYPSVVAKKYKIDSKRGIFIVDMGCGEAKFAQDVMDFVSSDIHPSPKTSKEIFNFVHSYDLSSPNKFVKKADMSHVPLPANSVDIVLFCISLMGTNLKDFIQEAIRILTPSGQIWIAEIGSRMPKLQKKPSAELFKNMVEKEGLSCVEMLDMNYFVLFRFTKVKSKKSVKPKSLDEGKGMGGSKMISKKDTKKQEKAIISHSKVQPDVPDLYLNPCIYMKRDGSEVVPGQEGLRRKHWGYKTHK
ncbi:Ribosomal RNA processing protein 8 like protein [Aduncisulcus paluster]|uniref:Ribosomal RNA-processing protein 8 n=1 Tax=Aduncisulcus paluster TaxID=2918883 RepID=A0ABQ5K320_9EUKA|nr:Ribosomal RNA processing protein 8 like protein [Aduncisulcus paluster]